MTDRAIRVVVQQAAPVLFQAEATVKKVESLFETDIGPRRPDLVLFPEAFVPAYPRGLSFGAVVGSRSRAGRELWLRYWNNAVDVPGPSTERFGALARTFRTHLAIGVIERQGHVRGGTLYCTVLLFNQDGTLVGRHRKIKPTGTERIIWGEGDASTLDVVETRIGKIGTLICWENYMPEARLHLYRQGVELYLAPTADSRDAWQATMRHIACEGRCFVLGCNQYVTKTMYPDDLPCRDELSLQPDVLCRGGSVIVSPMGEILAGPIYDAEGCLFAELDPDDLIRSRLDFDVVGHYARPDLFGN